MNLKFTKMHAYGNDYIYINAIAQDITKLDLPEIAVKLSNRRFCIGSDGIVIIDQSEAADFKMRMFNADGSEGAMCGNAVRSVAKYVYDNKMTERTEVTIETLSGIKTIHIDAENGKATNMRAEIGGAEFEAEKIPVRTNNLHFVQQTLNARGQVFEVTAVSVGNPHAIIFTDNVEQIDVAKYGEAIENMTELFQDKVNVSFVQILDEENIKLRFWERGSGETSGCGTGCCASVAVAHYLKKISNRVTAHQPGGKLLVEWDVEENILSMTGPATTVFEAEIEV